MVSMRIFIYEHTCAVGALRGLTPPARLDSLLVEGQAMLSAIVEDFRRLPGVEVVTVADGDEAAFRRQAGQADWTLVIAPEFDDILASRCRWVIESGGRLLGPSPEAVRLAGDKLALGEHWQRLGVPTPPCLLLLPGQDPPSIFFPAVYKPRHGAGSQATFLVHRPEDLPAAVGQARAEGQHAAGSLPPCGGGLGRGVTPQAGSHPPPQPSPARGEGEHDEMLVQPFVPGKAASVAWLIGPKDQLPLVPAEQHLSGDGRFHYQGGAVPLAGPAGINPAARPAGINPAARRAIELTRRAVTAVPGLLGYVGVDLVLGDPADGSQDQVIELNPRLTTSYIGLRALAQSNLAGTMLRIAMGESVDAVTWHPGSVRFTADGRVDRIV